MKYGILDTCLTDTWADLFDLARQVGFDGIELGVKASEAAANPLWQPATRQRLLEHARATGVAIASICLHGLGPMQVSADQPTRLRAMQVLADAIGFCRELGAGVILCPLGRPADMDYEVAFPRWVGGLVAAAPAAEAAGVKLGMESVGWNQEAGQSPARFQRLLASTNSPAVGVYYDMGNAIIQGYDPLAYIRELAPHIVQVHVKELEGKRLGAGTVDIPACLTALYSVGYAGYLVLETGREGDAVGSALHNLGYMKKIVR